MNKKTIKDIDIKGKRVFIRVDFNVPIKNGEIEDDTRIKGALPTIKYAVEQGAKVILASHLGRPIKDKKKAEEKGMPYDESKYSLYPVHEYLANVDFISSIEFANDCIGDEAQMNINAMKDGEAVLLENLRLHAGEEKNDAEFAKQLAELADVYVNDAFGTAHRAHASTEGITHYVDDCVAGLLMEKELNFLSKALNNPERPFVAILGGAKVSDKIPVIKSLDRTKG